MLKVSNQLISLASREMVWSRNYLLPPYSFLVSNQLISLASREVEIEFKGEVIKRSPCFQSINFPSE